MLKIAAENQNVILYKSPRDMKMVKLKSGQTFHCKYGKYAHNDIIGKPFGLNFIKNTLLHYILVILL